MRTREHVRVVGCLDHFQQGLTHAHAALHISEHAACVQALRKPPPCNACLPGQTPPCNACLPACLPTYLVKQGVRLFVTQGVRHGLLQLVRSQVLVLQGPVVKKGVCEKKARSVSDAPRALVERDS